MNKRKSVDKLSRTYSHRKAMLRNMTSSLFEHERIITTRRKGKALRSYAEVLITRACKSTQEKLSPAQKLHHHRLLLRRLRGRTIVKKLMEDIAPRFIGRPGGYLRIIHLSARKSDAAKMSIVELVDRREKVKRIPEADKATDKKQPEKTVTTVEQAPVAEDIKKRQSKEKTTKWYDRFRRKKREWE